ncbi:MAG: N-acetylmuramoyl-L-alanine amidase [Clostridia bacterium]|nr:N-acetylmuramoyl-L-alanine amidase [Clostridia bacterium]
MGKKKVYLSAASHATDNKTACYRQCSENTHCNQYMELVQQMLLEQGIDARRGSPAYTGETGMVKKVKEANAWGADLYYVAHTNAGGGRYSMTMCWGDAPSTAMANILHNHRRCVKTHKVVTRRDLYEIRATKMVCLYDELFFHDNAQDCAWFHDTGMQDMAEETVRAICEMLEVPYKDPPDEFLRPQAGDHVCLDKDELYLASTGNAAVIRSGTFYVYDGLRINGRYRVTNKLSRVKKTPIAANVSGWVPL